MLKNSDLTKPKNLYWPNQTLPEREKPDLTRPVLTTGPDLTRPVKFSTQLSPTKTLVYKIWKFPCTPMIDVPCQFCTKSIFISVVVLFYWINNIIFKTSFYFVYAHYLKRSSAIYMKYEYLSKQLLFRLSGVSKMHTKLFHL